MKRFIEGEDRSQVTLLPECLDDFIAEDNPVRVVDAFVEELDLQDLGFDGARPAETGRPSYHPAVLLKIYIYGYLNHIQSSCSICRPHLMASKPRFEEVLAFQWANDEFVHTPPDVQDFVRAGGILDQPHRYDRKRPDGRVIEVQSVPISGGGVLRTFSDITERKSHEERIRHVSRHDGLTSLVNREVFLEYLAGAAQAADHKSFAVHYIDLDRFKPINDRYGHILGDKVLASAAARMRAIARDVDIVARMGGDEFAILQRGVERLEQALGLAHRILEGVGQPMEIEEHHLQLGASIGIALCQKAGEDPDALLRNADAAMYAAKGSGRNRVRVFNS